MSSEPIVETDVNVIRSLILENRDLAYQIQEKAEMLYCSEASIETSAEPEEVSTRVGKEFIVLLNELRSTLNRTRKALEGFNG